MWGLESAEMPGINNCARFNHLIKNLVKQQKIEYITPIYGASKLEQIKVSRV